MRGAVRRKKYGIDAHRARYQLFVKEEDEETYSLFFKNSQKRKPRPSMGGVFAEISSVGENLLCYNPLQFSPLSNLDGSIHPDVRKGIHLARGPADLELRHLAGLAEAEYQGEGVVREVARTRGHLLNEHPATGKRHAHERANTVAGE